MNPTEVTVLDVSSLPTLNGSYRPDLMPERSVLHPLYREQLHVLAPLVDPFLTETRSTAAEHTKAIAQLIGN